MLRATFSERFTLFEKGCSPECTPCCRQMSAAIKAMVRRTRLTIGGERIGPGAAPRRSDPRGSQAIAADALGTALWISYQRLRLTCRGAADHFITPSIAEPFDQAFASEWR